MKVYLILLARCLGYLADRIFSAIVLGVVLAYILIEVLHIGG